jgi:S1-C subfamily serine protease
LQERTDAAMAMFREAGGGLFGARLIPVTPETARNYGYDNLRSGLIVAAVEDGSAAAQADLQVGDVIESAAGESLRSVEQLAELFDAANNRGSSLRCVVRRGREQFLLVIR